MSNLEIIYRYLSKGISGRSFRKWLITYENEDNLLSNLDFEKLKKYSVNFSNAFEIKNILQKYVDNTKLEQMIISNKLRNLVEKDEDILLKISKLKEIGEQLKDDEIIRYATNYINKFSNIPHLNERSKWNEAAFINKRKQLDNLQEEVINDIKHFRNEYEFK